MLSLDEAILLTRVSSRTIHRWIEAQSIHCAETVEGFVLICSVSLLKHSDVDSLFATPSIARAMEVTDE